MKKGIIFLGLLALSVSLATKAFSMNGKDETKYLSRKRAAAAKEEDGEAATADSAQGAVATSTVIVLKLTDLCQDVFDRIVFFLMKDWADCQALTRLRLTCRALKQGVDASRPSVPVMFGSPKCNSAFSRQVIFTASGVIVSYPFDQEGLQVFASFFHSSTHLRRVHFSRNDLSRTEGGIALGVVLSCSRVLEVELSDNQLSGNVGFAAVLPLANHLRSLRVSGNEVGDAGAQALAAVLPQTHLKSLRLSGNRIGKGGAGKLAAALPDCLEVLSLSGNVGIGDEGAKIIARVLPRTCLQSLFLEGIMMGDAGAKALAEVLPQTSLLRLCFLCDNKIGNLGAKALAEVLPQAEQLVTLDFTENDIEDEGAQALTLAFSEASLRRLGLRLNKIKKRREFADTVRYQVPGRSIEF